MLTISHSDGHVFKVKVLKVARVPARTVLRIELLNDEGELASGTWYARLGLIHYDGTTFSHMMLSRDQKTWVCGGATRLAATSWAVLRSMGVLKGSEIEKDIPLMERISVLRWRITRLA